MVHEIFTIFICGVSMELFLVVVGDVHFNTNLMREDFQKLDDGVQNRQGVEN